MDGLFTRNRESDADVIAPILAKDFSVAAGIYFWLHSRAFACHNVICISEAWLAMMLGVDRKSVLRAVAKLAESGLITFESRPGNGGGCVFHVLNLTDFACGGTEKANVASTPRLGDSDVAQKSRLTGQGAHMTKTLTKKGENCAGERPRKYGVYDF